MSHRVIITSEKRSFLTNIFLKKLQDAGVDCEFSQWKVNEINDSYKEAPIVVLFMEDDTRPSDEALHFLIDKGTESGTMLIPVGEQNDVDFICKHYPKDMIYRAFVRPVNNDEFVETIVTLLKKMDAGEFKKSILVVDDDPTYLALVRDWLKEQYKVSMATSGLQAIKWLGKNKVDLILLDHEMPVTSGPKVLEMLRSDAETSSIPVMFLTGKSDKESVMSVVALKPEGYFLKTIEKNELLKNLDEYFMKHK